ncbi:hypothetical protein [Endozoicomonas numazuensis]|uniref:Fungal lipase-like domain-containing protein n=1 Tax=Endozoicomonas numazuensis TaxID=1137799 RepID=A0A081NCS6_9GAMM|nr:hypothetical protein [Endozoicomonas numazuensis]KEQ16249.1 hypothetical protein GZ78_23835 [Endozoicomonas numazuensis]
MDRFKLGMKTVQHKPLSEKEFDKPQKTGLLGRWKVKLSKSRGRYSPQNTALKTNTYKLKQREIRKLAVNSSPPTEPKALRSMAIDAQLAAYPYHRSLEKIRAAGDIHKPDKEDFAANWKGSSEMAELIASDAGLTLSSEDPGFMYDQETGLTAYVLINPELKEVRLIFGGTTSGLNTGEFLKRSRKNIKFTGKQWQANIKNALGKGIPDSFKQARELTASLLEKMPVTPDGQPFSLKLHGHSKGGAEASYAALSMVPPVEAVCFSSSELNRVALSDIPRENLAKAEEKITHYTISKDLVSNTGRHLRGLAHTGKVITLPAKHAYNSLLDRHDKFTRHIEHYARNAAR